VVRRRTPVQAERVSPFNAVESLSVSGGGLERRTRAERPRRRWRVRARGRDARRPHAPARRGRAVPEVRPLDNENGKFAWIMDPDGNKVELWEPKLWDDKNKGA
jgi:hypothetical protein